MATPTLARLALCLAIAASVFDIAPGSFPAADASVAAAQAEVTGETFEAAEAGVEGEETPFTASQAQEADLAAQAPAASLPARIAGPEYGMNIFIWGAPQTTNRDLQKLSELGFTWQKTLFQWRHLEPEKGVYTWSEADRVVQASNAAGINIIARVDFQPPWASTAHNGPPASFEDFGDFVYALASRYRPGSPNGTVAAVELWNEPNLAREWGDRALGPEEAAEYVRLMCIGHEAVKLASPQTVTITGGLSPTGTMNEFAIDDTVYLGWMYQSGAQPCFDVLGAHGAGYKAPPWVGPEELATSEWGGHASFGFRRVEQLRDIMVAYGDADKQVWLLEFGWTSDPIHEAYAWHRVTEEQKAEYIVEAYRWAYLNWQPWIGVMVLWNFSAPDWSQSREEYWWGITNPDGTNRPAYDALMAARSTGYLPGPGSSVAAGLPSPRPPAGASTGVSPTVGTLPTLTVAAAPASPTVALTTAPVSSTVPAPTAAASPTPPPATSTPIVPLPTPPVPLPTLPPLPSLP